MKKSLFTWAFICISFSLWSQPKAPTGKSWELVETLSDEFNANSLDSKKWRNYHPYWTGRGSTFRPYNVWVENGSLRLKSTRGKKGIDAACVSSQNPKFEKGYYSEARIWCPSMSMTGAYWFQNRSESEIDVIENFGKPTNHTKDRYRMLVNTHYFANGWENDEKSPWHNGSAILKPYACDETYYVYGVWWKDEHTIIFYLDGKEVHRVTTKSEFTQPMYMFFDMEVFGWWGAPKEEDLADSTKNTQYVDWVRTFKLRHDKRGITGGEGISKGDKNTDYPKDPRQKTSK
ncbi:family 16 glycosylhydrolase [Seonamhaeicola marinus]|nr:family 16 glycosylhydrolase [Seonamhaeicola marinus]